MGIEDGYNPEETLPNNSEIDYPRGRRVRVPRSDGKIESHWEILGNVTPDRKIHIFEPFTKESKMIETETLDKYNGPLRVGSVVKIRRNNNLVDDGWEITKMEEAGPEATVIIKKDLPTPEGIKTHKKTVKMSDITAVN